MKNVSFLISFIFLVNSTLLLAQGFPTEDWMHSSYSTHKMHGIQSDKSYNDLLKDKKGIPVIVAILDSGIDVEHEDLKDNIWVNYDEIPNNNIDDDNNGYIDDVNGWNFIGGVNEDIHHETYEVTRLYGAMRAKYENAKLEDLSKEEKKEYSKFVKYKEEVETKRAKAQKSIDQIMGTKSAYHNALNALKENIGQSFVTNELLDSVYGEDQNLIIGKNIMKDILKDYTEGIDIDTILYFVDLDLDGAAQDDLVQLNYAYNPDYNSREIIGDDYSDPKDIYYGNNRVEGPDALHGTHVGGIVGALRNNEIGMNGVASNVKLMSVRVVPDGDERDKDVANAIRYAVDNGASVINMSFGKGHSWDKESVDKAVQYALKKDVLLVHAAGNSSNDNDISENYPNDTYEKPTGFLFWKKKKADNWLEIGALNYSSGEGMVAPFSNYGKENVDLFAPGMGIYSTIPNNQYRHLQGTSMASPVVAGAAAVLRSYYPSLSAVQIKTILMEASSKIDQEVNLPGNRDVKVNFSELSVSGGVLNLYDAIILAGKTKGKKKVKKSKTTRA